MESAQDLHARIKSAVDHVREEIARAAVNSGRSPDEIALLAVTKTRSPAEVNAAIAAGVTLLGENRVQEAEAKIPHVAGGAEWHLIGHLQTNKARLAAKLFRTVQSVDSVRLAEKLNDAVESGRTLDVLIEVNVSNEASKFGVAPAFVGELVEKLVELPALRVRGFMTIGAFVDDERLVRRGFRLLREIFDDTRRQFPSGQVDTLSMGMTGDFRWAIAEGSTMVRIGTALFGQRQQRGA
ncbi:MAG TPA: YggS family pyridoxal phosphate-dependent enzyme [Candidatus Latescibacteria bacterium]|nr:YggS family pyridoxal phosphate-dependent enzyme [Candidatus Latescibacterota bacterium]